MADSVRFPRTFRYWYSSAMFGWGDAELLAVFKWKRCAYLYQDAFGFVDRYASFKESARELGIEVVASDKGQNKIPFSMTPKEVQNGALDSVLEEVIDSKIRVLFIFAGANHLFIDIIERV
jgi:hypothetical protein